MGSGLAFLLQLLVVFAAITQLLCVDSSLMIESTKSTATSKRGGITASLIHRDDYFDSEWLTHREKMERDARRSHLRVQSFVSKRKLAEELASSGNLAPDSQDWLTPLSDGAPAEYLMQISLGTPAQTFVAIADTGSDLTWLQCAPCQACIQNSCGGCQDGVFDITKSNTSSPLSCSSTACEFLNQTLAFCPYSSGASNTGEGCEYGYGYGDGSQTAGNIIQDTISLQTANAVSTVVVPNYQFGCSHQAASNSSLLNGADGLVGLGRGNISFPSQLGTDFGNIFGYCLVNRSSFPNNVVAASSLFFGSDAVPATLPSESLQYTPIIPAGPTFYYVNCTGISLGGNNISAIPASLFDIQNSSGGIFFDSGTTFTTLWENIFNPLSQALVTQITTHGPADISGDSGLPLCYSAKWSDWINDYGKGVPIISFQFSNTSGFPLLVDTAWVSDPKNGIVCLAISSTSQNVNIFGNTQQVGYHIFYDLGKLQIGFVREECAARIVSSSHRPMASIGTSLVTGLVSLLLLLVLTQ